MTKVTSLRAKLFNEDSKWIYEELVSFFGNESLVPKNREEFSKWLRRGEWQTRKCDELAKENEKLKKQLESKEDIEMETAAGTLGDVLGKIRAEIERERSFQRAMDEYDIAIGLRKALEILDKYKTESKDIEAQKKGVSEKRWI